MERVPVRWCPGWGPLPTGTNYDIEGRDQEEASPPRARRRRINLKNSKAETAASMLTAEGMDDLQVVHVKLRVSGSHRLRRHILWR